MAPLSANAAACYTQKEWEAAHVQVLQRTLQVAALECANVPGRNYDAQYNEFIARFTTQIRQNGVYLRSHFQRVYGRSGQTYLDRFITSLSNEASAKSMNSNTFCADSAAVFKAALAIEPKQLPTVALQTVTDDSEIGTLCHTAAPKKAVKSKKVVAHKKATTTKKVVAE
ncbi:MAG TPA: hypothetical protein VL574_01705 [Stellaceae bacterium]|nr:hypothetical protein [Stellaceae bacterium]